jgi:iron uptake system EfeUOB component EfeO/EfeM
MFWVVAVAAGVSFLTFAVGSAPLVSGASGATLRPCSTYPRPGKLAPRGSSVPSAIRRRYGLFRRGQRADDRLLLGKLRAPLPASGIVSSGIRLLGRAGDGGRLYAIPAKHFLPYRIAPARCLSASENLTEYYLLPSLRRDYAQPAVCVVEVGGNDPVATRVENCAPLSGTPEAMLGTEATPLLGLAPDGVTSVTARYLTAPARRVRVRHNFYEIVGPPPAAKPCGVEWLDASGNVEGSAAGCDYVPAEVGPMSTYRNLYVVKELATVRADVSALAGAISTGNLAEAESDWLTAHLAWLDIGQDDGAYGCFGDLGGEIDGTAAGLVGGTASPQFTGFHKIELDLWGDENLTAAAADTATLQQLMETLVAIPLATELPATDAGVAGWVLRPHEILEDALRDTLTGDDDYGSGTGLASITADVAAIKQLLGLLAPVLDPLAPDLVARANEQLDAVLAAIDQTEINGTWVAVKDLPSPARERVDAAVGAALETLAPIPDLLTSTGNAAPSS